MNCFVVRGGLAEPRGARDGIHKRRCEGKLSDRLLEWCYLDASGYRVRSWLGNASAFGFAVNETVITRVIALHYFTRVLCNLHSYMGWNGLLQADEITGLYIFHEDRRCAASRLSAPLNSSTCGGSREPGFHTKQ